MQLKSKRLLNTPAETSLCVSALTISPSPQTIPQNCHSTLKMPQTHFQLQFPFNFKEIGLLPNLLVFFFVSSNICETPAILQFSYFLKENVMGKVAFVISQKETILVWRTYVCVHSTTLATLCNTENYEFVLYVTLW